MPRSLVPAAKRRRARRIACTLETVFLSGTVVYLFSVLLFGSPWP